jgi:hypothetical protein
MNIGDRLDDNNSTPEQIPTDNSTPKSHRPALDLSPEAQAKAIEDAQARVEKRLPH